MKKKPNKHPVQSTRVNRNQISTANKSAKLEKHALSKLNNIHKCVYAIHYTPLHRCRVERQLSWGMMCSWKELRAKARKTALLCLLIYLHVCLLTHQSIISKKERCCIAPCKMSQMQIQFERQWFYHHSVLCNWTKSKSKSYRISMNANWKQIENLLSSNGCLLFFSGC